MSHLATPPTGANYFDVGEVVKVKEKERMAISRAVEKWTEEYYRKLSSEL